jgi:site-specific DNA-methyltransferase (adenine-specific)
MNAPLSFLNGKVCLYAGDCLEVLDALEENSFDSCATDPPYHLGPQGFMGRSWDAGSVAFRPTTWAKVLRVLKPGAHLVAFAAPKNSHRIVCAIEDAGFEIRDGLQWMFGTGFPKSLQIALEFEKRLCERREVGASREWFYRGEPEKMRRAPPFRDVNANEWAGWGTALKPAFEPICLARKPISEISIAANVLRWSTGALNIDGCRVGCTSTQRNNTAKMGYHGRNIADQYSTGSDHGRGPANVLHDGSEEVIAAFPESDGARGGNPREKNGVQGVCFGTGLQNGGDRVVRNDFGSAARFFYSAKADSDDRIGSKHPTVKPVDLMQWLVRPITPPGGLVLDPFAGSGTTGEAAFREGFRATLIEREEEYRADIARRMDLVRAGPSTRKAESAKVRGGKCADLPLFGEGQ